MGGLLYKDFVFINRLGKVKLTWVVTFLTLLFIILRIAFPGTAELEDFVFKNENGEIVNLIDSFMMYFYAVFMIASLSFVSAAKIMGNDEKNKIKVYLNTMPLEKNTYVASKYLFVGISAYVFMSIDIIWGITCAAFCREGIFMDLVSMLNSFIGPFVSLALFLASIEIPLYISVGKEIAMRVMTVFWTAIALIVIGFLLFGDLSIVENWDILAFMDFVEKHKTGIILFQAMEPVIILVIYYLSYRLSSYLYKRGGEKE